MFVWPKAQYRSTTVCLPPGIFTQVLIFLPKNLVVKKTFFIFAPDNLLFNYVSINRSETENTTHVVLAFIGVQSTANGKEDISGSVVLAQNKEVTLRVYVGIQNEEGSPPVLSDKP